ncbi:MAG: DUF4126 domain-containing protein [Chloroflexi bacterium]|nr:DUF4126 domain-containing protein [Chloroflexota bacterium]
MGVVDVFAAFGLSASAGLNAYLSLLIVAVSAKLNIITLEQPFDVMESWWVIGVLIVLTLIEIFVDKIPAADSLNDIIGTVVRPAAGAILFAASAGVVTELSPVLSIILGLLMAGSVHAVKMTTRPVVTTTTAGIGNPVVSTAEDIVAGTTALLAVLLPGLVALVAVLGIVLFLAWRIRRLNRLERERAAAR